MVPASCRLLPGVTPTGHTSVLPLLGLSLLGRSDQGPQTGLRTCAVSQLCRPGVCAKVAGLLPPGSEGEPLQGLWWP